MPHGAWTAARRDILEAFAAGERLIALIGPPGVGKSRLLREIENSLRSPEFRVLRLESGEWADAATAPQVLLVDEAGRMDDATLEQLADRLVGFTVLVGLPAFAERLEALQHRIVELGPLRTADIPAYVAARLAGTGLDEARLADGTVAALAEASGGIPRLLNLLIGTSFLVADIAGSREVRPEHVREAAALRTEMSAYEASREPAALLSGSEEAASQQPAAPPPPIIQASPSRSLAPVSTLVEPPPALPAPARAHGHLAVAAAVLMLGGGLAWYASQGRQASFGPDAPVPASGQPAVPSPPATQGGGTAAPGSARTEPAGEPAREVAPAAAPASGPAGAPGAPESGTGTEQPGSTAALPSGAMVRVVITYPRGTAGAAQRAATLTTELDRAGLSVGVPFPISRPAAGPELSFFFREDRDAALQVRRIGGAQLAQAVPRLRPAGAALPRPGTIEVGLPGTTAAPDDGPYFPEEGEAPAPEPATLSGPPNGAVLSTDAAQRGVALSWRVAGEARPGCCFVEVVALGGENNGREVFAAYSEAADQQIARLDRPGRYAWRILTVSRAARRYTASPWRHFVLGEAPS
ncbi:MAG TPA: hypothetical protein VIL69_07350 [Roseomonas sp.]|jgi:hypothetical protein